MNEIELLISLLEAAKDLSDLLHKSPSQQELEDITARAKAAVLALEERIKSMSPSDSGV